jgi:hypothetical protein
MPGAVTPALPDALPAECPTSTGEGLVTEAGHRRYGMHDLLRRYARDHTAAHPGQALDRLVGYYQAHRRPGSGLPGPADPAWPRAPRAGTFAAPLIPAPEQPPPPRPDNDGEPR